MKTQLEIQSKIQALLTAEYQQRCEAHRRRLPHRCRHNIRHTLDTLKYRYDEENPLYNRITRAHHLPVLNTMGLCGLHFDEGGNPTDSPTGEWNGDVICDEERIAETCPYYSAITKPSDIYRDFIRDIGDPVWVSANLPTVWELLWVLDQMDVTIPWWRRLWLRMMAFFVKETPLRIPERISLSPYQIDPDISVREIS